MAELGFSGYGPVEAVGSYMGQECSLEARFSVIGLSNFAAHVQTGPLSCCFILHEPTTQHANGPGIKFWAAAAAAHRMDEEDLNLNRKNK